MNFVDIRHRKDIDFTTFTSHIPQVDIFVVNLGDKMTYPPLSPFIYVQGQSNSVTVRNDSLKSHLL